MTCIDERRIGGVVDHNGAVTDEEIAERIRLARRRDMTPYRIGGHRVLVETVRQPAGVLTTVHRVLDGQITVLRAAADSFSHDVAQALLDVPAVSTGTVHPIPTNLPGSKLSHALVLGPSSPPGPDPELDQRTVTVVAVHRSEFLVGEPEKDFHTAISKAGTGLYHHLNDWNRHPIPRADARLLDDWPGGSLRRSPTPHPTNAERLLTQVVPDCPAGVRFEIRSMLGHELLLQRRWDRGIGTINDTDGAAAPIDLPRHELWAALEPIFRTDAPSTISMVRPGTPEQDVLELRYWTEDRGSAGLPLMKALGDCLARLDKQILRTPGNWAVFTSRSDVVIQVKCTDDRRLWLETPDPSTSRSRGRVVTTEEAANLLEILARQDRSGVDELPGTETIPWE